MPPTETSPAESVETKSPPSAPPDAGAVATATPTPAAAPPADAPKKRGRKPGGQNKPKEGSPPNPFAAPVAAPPTAGQAGAADPKKEDTKVELGEENAKSLVAMLLAGLDNVNLAIAWQAVKEEAPQIFEQARTLMQFSEKEREAIAGPLTIALAKVKVPVWVAILAALGGVYILKISLLQAMIASEKARAENKTITLKPVRVEGVS